MHQIDGIVMGARSGCHSRHRDAYYAAAVKVKHIEGSYRHE